jgi:hypothetical protein
MKRYFSKTIIALLISSFALAHDGEVNRGWDKEHRYAVAVDPVSWVGGNFKLQLEGSFNDRLSINMPISFGVKEAIFKNTNFAGGYFAPRFGVKYYVTGKATHQGFYVNPLVGFFVGKLDGVTSSTGGFSYGFRFGYAWNIWRGFWMDAYVGYEDLVTTFNSDKNPSGNTNGGGIPEGDGFELRDTLGGARVGFMLGYNW